MNLSRHFRNKHQLFVYFLDLLDSGYFLFKNILMKLSAQLKLFQINGN